MKSYNKVLTKLVLVALLLLPLQARPVEPNYTPYVAGCAVGLTATIALTVLAQNIMDTAEEEITVPNVAQIMLDGPIFQTSQLINDIIHLQTDDRFDAVLLIINSGGGYSGQSEILYHALKNLAQVKPVVAVVIDMCCSGTYLLASSATKIVAPSLASIGCIGVLSSIVKTFPEKYKDETTEGTIEVYPFSAGKYKSMAHSNMPLTDDEKEAKQREIDSTYDVFCRLVAESRGLDLDMREKWADGLVFSGDQALRLRLIDQTGGINEAVNVVKSELRKRGHTFEQIQLIKV